MSAPVPFWTRPNILLRTTGAPSLSMPKILAPVYFWTRPKYPAPHHWSIFFIHAKNVGSNKFFGPDQNIRIHITGAPSLSIPSISGHFRSEYQKGSRKPKDLCSRELQMSKKIVQFSSSLSKKSCP